MLTRTNGDSATVTIVEPSIYIFLPTHVQGSQGLGGNHQPGESNTVEVGAPGCQVKAAKREI